MKKRMFSLVLCLVFIIGTVSAKGPEYWYTCPECHVKTNLCNVPYVPAHDGALHIKNAWKSFTNWWNSVSTPFDLNG